MSHNATIKRLNIELTNRKYDILDYKEDYIYGSSPKIIRIWQNNYHYVDFNVVEYPFKRPFIVNSNLFNINHNLYSNVTERFKLNDYVSISSNKKPSDFCLYCNSILSCDFDWTPRYMLYHIVKQLEQINCLLSSVIKLNVLKRNSNIPEDVFSYMFKFLTPSLDDILEIKLDEVDRLKKI